MNPHIDMKAFDISEKKNSKINYLLERKGKALISFEIQNKYGLLCCIDSSPWEQSCHHSRNFRSPVTSLRIE